MAAVIKLCARMSPSPSTMFGAQGRHVDRAFEKVYICKVSFLLLLFVRMIINIYIHFIAVLDYKKKGKKALIKKTKLYIHSIIRARVSQ